MDQNQTSVIVALIPQDDSWCKVEPAHMTIVYVGETLELKVNKFNELAKDISSIALLTNPIMAKVIGTDVFGDQEKVDVLLISSTPEILSVRRMLESWDTSEFPSFEPHMTIGPAGITMGWELSQTPLPMFVCFDRIMLLWGTERLTFWLRKY